MKYRSDIDGLRAVAVGAVVLFHAKLLGVTGGFVGVDIFFVISGYLITLLLQDDVASNRFSLVRFYDRRIRRILPAYALVALATTLASYLILPPDELAAYGRRLASTAVFASNFLFRRELGYFDRSSSDNPLLHTWSLSVEEQFYIAWPLFIAVLAQHPLVRWRRPLVLLFFILSFAVSAYAAFTRPLAAFYYSPLRAWELLLGAVIAMDFVPRLSRQANEGLAVLALLLIAFPIFSYTDSETIFPGASALLPCLGAALILLCGRDKQTFVGRMLSVKPLVFTGLISYSLYLWHWPIMVFLRLYSGHDLGRVEALSGLVVSYLVAILSWRVVEQPFRKHRSQEPARIPVSIPWAVAALTVLLAIGVVTDVRKGWQSRSNDGVTVVQTEMNLQARGEIGCMADATTGTRPRNEGCLLGWGGEHDVSAILLGDSHAGAYAAAVDQIAKDLGFTARQWTKSACSPLLFESTPSFWEHYVPNRNRDSCRRYNQAVLEHLVSAPQLKTVIIGGFWSSMQDDRAANAARRPAGPAAQSLLRAGLGRFVAALHGAGKTVILLGQVPQFPNGGGDCVVRQRFLQRDASRICSVSASYEQALLSPSDGILADLAQKYSDVFVYRGSGEFCSNTICSPIFGEHVAYRDEHHLSYPGSIYLAPRMKLVFEQAGLSAR